MVGDGNMKEEGLTKQLRNLFTFLSEMAFFCGRMGETFVECQRMTG